MGLRKSLRTPVCESKLTIKHYLQPFMGKLLSKMGILERNLYVFINKVCHGRFFTSHI